MSEQSASTWRKASYSSGSGACVEIAILHDDTIGVRDSKNPGTNLTTTRTAWAAFLADATHGRFDL